MTPAFPPRRIRAAKITEYLLNASHEIGSAKAAYFTSFGFSRHEWERLALALQTHPDRHPVDETRTDEWGTRFAVRCSIVTPDGRNPCIVSVWIVRVGRDEAELVTAYPAGD